MPAGEIEKEFSPFDTSYIVITGGEPMIHSDLVDLVKVIARPEGHITIETAGIQFLPDLRCDLMSRPLNDPCIEPEIYCFFYPQIAVGPDGDIC